MSNQALLIIDMLNEYLTPNGLVYCDKCREIIPNIKACIEKAHEKHIDVIYLNTSLNDSNDVMVKKWGLHAVEGTSGAQVIEELKPTDHDTIVKKKGYDGFFDTKLHNILATRNINTVAITGIHTHVCVLFTAVGAFERGYNVLTLDDCITTGYLPNHETRLRFFRTHIGNLTNSSQWIANLS